MSVEIWTYYTVGNWGLTFQPGYSPVIGGSLLISPDHYEIFIFGSRYFTSGRHTVQLFCGQCQVPKPADYILVARLEDKKLARYKGTVKRDFNLVFDIYR
jgi:hypothetical protein